jgi:hypothetical protein
MQVQMSGERKGGIAQFLNQFPVEAIDPDDEELGGPLGVARGNGRRRAPRESPEAHQDSDDEKENGGNSFHALTPNDR